MAMTFPALGVSEKEPIALWRTAQKEPSCSLYAFVKGYWSRLKLFDASGMEWAVAEAVPTRPCSQLAKWLAPICYNPIITVTLRFEKPRHYTVDRLRQLVCQAIDHDEDIMTQFVEADALKAHVQATTSLADLIAVLIDSHAIE